MQSKFPTLAFSAIILLSSCGSKPDPARMFPERMMDSLAIEAHESEMEEQGDTSRVKQAISTELTDLKRRLITAEKELEKLSETNLGMTKSEKEQALIDKVVEIENLKSQIELLERMNKSY